MYADLSNLPNNTLVIARDQVEEYETHCFSAFASSLQLPPGQWPRNIEVKGNQQFGNGQLLHLKRVEEHGAEYAQGLGCISLTIFND